MRGVFQHQHISQPYLVSRRGGQSGVVGVVIHDVDDGVVAGIDDVRHLILVMPHLVSSHSESGEVVPLDKYPRHPRPAKLFPQARHLLQWRGSVRKVDARQGVKLGGEFGGRKV